MMKVKKDGRIDEDAATLREIDLHVHVKNSNSVCTSNQVFPLSWFEDTIPYQNNGGPPFNIGSLKVFYYFKLGGRKAEAYI